MWAAVAGAQSWLWSPGGAGGGIAGEREEWASASIAWAPTETIEDSTEKFGFLEAAGRMSLGYYWLRSGSFDFDARARLWLTLDGGRYEVPGALAQLFVRTRWDLRLSPITARFEAMPGYYAEPEHVEWDDFNLPVAASAIFEPVRGLSGQAGFVVYPGFENYLDPILRVRWQPAALLTADVGYPETRVAVCPHPQLKLVGGWQVNRVWQFSLSSDDRKGDFMMRDQRLYLGLDVGEPGRLTFSARLTWLLERELDYEAGLYQDAQVDDGVMYWIGVSGEF